MPTAEQWRRFRADPAWVARDLAQKRERYARMHWWLDCYKLSHGCMDCGWAEHPAALHFDHTDGKTHRMPDLTSPAAALREIARHRVVVRCANCHMVRTYEEQLGRPARALAMEAK